MGSLLYSLKLLVVGGGGSLGDLQDFSVSLSPFGTNKCFEPGWTGLRLGLGSLTFED